MRNIGQEIIESLREFTEELRIGQPVGARLTKHGIHVGTFESFLAQSPWSDTVKERIRNAPKGEVVSVIE